MLDAAVPRHRVAVADERARRRARRARVLRLQPPRAGAAPGKIQDAEAAAACRMLDQAGYGRLPRLGEQRPAEPARLPAGGHLMTPAHDHRRRPAVFVQQLHRAAAQRGRLDPVYQDLSDHWTAILQRLYPVWALIGPGLSDPGHIEIHSRTVYLDSETLLGPRAAIAAGALERRAILRLLRGRAARDAPRQAHQALGDRARHRAVGIGGPGRPAARDRPAAARGAADGGARGPRLPARLAARPVRPARAAGRGRRRDPARVRGADARERRRGPR